MDVRDALADLLGLVVVERVDGQLEVVEHRQQVEDQPLVGRQGLLLALADLPLAVVVEVGGDALQELLVRIALGRDALELLPRCDQGRIELGEPRLGLHRPLLGLSGRGASDGACRCGSGTLGSRHRLLPRFLGVVDDLGVLDDLLFGLARRRRRAAVGGRSLALRRCVDRLGELVGRLAERLRAHADLVRVLALERRAQVGDRRLDGRARTSSTLSP